MTFDYNEYEAELMEQASMEYNRLGSIICECPKKNCDCTHCDANVICEEPCNKEKTDD